MKLSDYIPVFLLVVLTIQPINYVFGAENLLTSATFQRNLKIGSYGDDVFLLQKILNSRKETIVSNSGEGSPGNETKYFGAKTLVAVMRFQQLYKGDILVPAGQTFATGYVGSFTRLKLDSFLPKTAPVVDAKIDPVITENQNLSQIQQNMQSPEVPPAPNSPIILKIYPDSGPDGTSVTITGENFSKTGNDIFTEYGMIKDVPSSDGKSLQFTITSPFPIEYRKYYPNYTMKVFTAIGEQHSNFVDFTITN